MSTKKPSNDELARQLDPWYWSFSSKIQLQAGQYLLKGHEYQTGPFRSRSRRQVFKKGAQMGFTDISVLKTIHGQIYGKYPQGALYLFPTANDVSDFSKARFGPLISNNPHTIGRFVKDTDAVNVKRINKSMLYLRGARSTQVIDGLKKTSSQLKSIPVDRVVLDEKDEMDTKMIDMALERMGHSEVKEEVHISTPSIPDFGIDRDYQDSTQNMWFLRCGCGHETCLEADFPESLGVRNDGTVFRKCGKCGGEVHPRKGRWVEKYPGRESHGWWISQLNSMFVSPKSVLDSYLSPPNGNLAEVYNSKLGMAYIAAENRLTRQDVYACCGNDAVAVRDNGPCAMGVDVGSTLHTVIGKRLGKKYKIIYVGEVPEFSDLHDLAKRFGVKVAVIDYPYDKRKVKEFMDAEPYKVLGSQYQDNMKDTERKDERAGVITIDRTYICDVTHNLVSEGMIELPRRNEVVEQYAKQLCDIAKILEEDERTGSKLFRYRKLGADHYRHATNYFYMASQEKVYESVSRNTTQTTETTGKAWSPFQYA